MNTQHLRIVEDGDVERLRKEYLSHEVSALQATVENLTRLVVAMQAHGPHAVPSESADLLYGVPSIAAHLKMGERQVYHLVAKGELPTFKIGGRVCARRSTIATWLANEEVRQ